MAFSVMMVFVIAAGRIRIVLKRTVEVSLYRCICIAAAAAEMADTCAGQRVLCTAADAAA